MAKGRTRTGGRRGGGLVVDDPAVGKRLFQFGNAGVGDVSGREKVEILQLGHFLEVHQPRISYLGP